ncbi:MAG: hypothetical protein M3014_10435 [Chloroflexota bacterium]|nr:hypothetical protein [Chloroflexota bacterium]
MTHKLLLDVPEDVYMSLVETAKEEGQPPELLAAQWLSAVIRSAESDPLDKWIGAFSGNTQGWADEHDKHLGEAILMSLHDTPEDSSSG